jgi:hypothetical protein
MHTFSPEEIKLVDDVQDHKKTIKDLNTTWTIHRFVLLYNWDDGINDLLKLVSRKEIDLGSLLYIYWLADPINIKKFPKQNIELENLLEKIENKVNKSTKVNTKIKFNFNKFVKENKYSENDLDIIPKYMKLDIEGEICEIERTIILTKIRKLHLEEDLAIDEKIRSAITMYNSKQKNKEYLIPNNRFYNEYFETYPRTLFNVMINIKIDKSNPKEVNDKEELNVILNNFTLLYCKYLIEKYGWTFAKHCITFPKSGKTSEDLIILSPNKIFFISIDRLLYLEEYHDIENAVRKDLVLKNLENILDVFEKKEIYEIKRKIFEVSVGLARYSKIDMSEFGFENEVNLT